MRPFLRKLRGIVRAHNVRPYRVLFAILNIDIVYPKRAGLVNVM